MSAFKRIGLVGRPGHSGVVDSLRSLGEVLKSLGLKVLVDQISGEMLQGESFELMERDRLAGQCDLVIVVGGDGSMLGVAPMLAEHDVPVLGVNRGRLGFLTDILPDEIEARLRDILAGHFTEEHRFLIECELRRGGKVVQSGVALNDVVLHPGTSARMIEFELFINEQFVHSQQSDGLIVATPTGSTAYALSAGGPIMHPSLNALVLVPMYPHSLGSRPLVVDADSLIRVVVGKQRSIIPQVGCDGSTGFAAHPGDELIVRKRPGALRLVHPLDYNFYQTCRSKLGWGNRLGRADD
ncbi:MAG: NAD(+) kinase [Pseudomonadales bacterium]|nr:NAD(+) kinase [Pseudomonadales bacterium]MCP5331440.1 NAD(+) kinase [Pseudomonadales bacterium]MCP5344817.1 NAD(+) kinase [Pseudomonadales bacterium]